MTIVKGSVSTLDHGERIPVALWMPRSEPLTARYLSARKREDMRLRDLRHELQQRRCQALARRRSITPGHKSDSRLVWLGAVALDALGFDFRRLAGPGPNEVGMHATGIGPDHARGAAAASVTLQVAPNRIEHKPTVLLAPVAQGPAVNEIQGRDWQQLRRQSHERLGISPLAQTVAPQGEPHHEQPAHGFQIGQPPKWPFQARFKCKAIARPGVGHAGCSNWCYGLGPAAGPGVAACQPLLRASANTSPQRVFQVAGGVACSSVLGPYANVVEGLQKRAGPDGKERGFSLSPWIHTAFQSGAFLLINVCAWSVFRCMSRS